MSGARTGAGSCDASAVTADKSVIFGVTTDSKPRFYFAAELPKGVAFHTGQYGPNDVAKAGGSYILSDDVGGWGSAYKDSTVPNQGSFSFTINSTGTAVNALSRTNLHGTVDLTMPPLRSIAGTTTVTGELKIHVIF
jgi:hypothetical protein